MSLIQPKTKEQMNRIFGLASKLNIEFDDEGIRAEHAHSISGGRVQRISELSFDEANQLIKNFGGDPFTPGSKRTRNHHRKQAGIQQIATPAQIGLMHALATERGMSEEGLKRMGMTMLKHWPPRTTSETNKLVEAIKAMNARDERRAA